MNSAIIVAAGSGKRFGADRPKQFLEIAGKPLIFHTLLRFDGCDSIGEIVLVLSADWIENFKTLAENQNFKKLNKIVAGGKTRAESVFNGLKAVDEKCEIVAVHDGARPLVSSEEIFATIKKARETGAACLTAKVTDTIKRVEGDKITGTIDRNSLRRALTPQCFQIEILRKACENADLSEAVTDECFLVEKAGYEIAFVDGSAKNIKITTREDFAVAEIFLKVDRKLKERRFLFSENYLQTMFRIGFGNDIHRLESGKPLILGGVKIESELGAVGHSDADALLHAITDAIFGALALGDIGSHFSDKDEKWKNADSKVFLAEAVRLMKSENYRVANVDSTINLEKPKLRPYIEKMCACIAHILEVELNCISVKAKTGEKIDAVGNSLAVKTEAVVLLQKN